MTGKTGATGRMGGLAATLLAFAAFEAALLFAPGFAPVTKTPVDALHLLDGLARIAAGQRAHADFSTPVGALAFEAPAALARLGRALGAEPGWGMAVAAGNAAMAAAAGLLTLWLAASRMRPAAAFLLGAGAMLTALAWLWSGGGSGASLAPHYNRWSWALFTPLLPLLVMPPGAGLATGRRAESGQRAVPECRATAIAKSRADWIDGLALGLTGALLLWLKITFAAALAGLWLVWLLAFRRRRAAGVAAASGIAAALALGMAFGGVETMTGYVGDLAAAARSGARPWPGMTLFQTAFSPAQAPATLALTAAAALLWRAGLRREATLWAAMTVALILLAWQNAGNGLTGMIAAPAMLWALAARIADGLAARRDPGRAPSRAAMLAPMLAAGLAALALPALLAAQASLLVAWRMGDRLRPALASHGVLDIRFEPADPAGWTRLPAAPPTRAFGQDFPACDQGYGIVPATLALAAMLRARPDLAGKTVTTADVVNPVWAYAGAPMQRGAQLWRYGPLGPALAGAALLAIPDCPRSPAAREAILREAEAMAAPWRRVAREGQWTILAQTPPSRPPPSQGTPTR